MAVMSHAVHLNVKYEGGGHEPFPAKLLANGSYLNNLSSPVIFSRVDIKTTAFEWEALKLDDSSFHSGDWSSKCKLFAGGERLALLRWGKAFLWQERKIFRHHIIEGATIRGKFYSAVRWNTLVQTHTTWGDDDRCPCVNRLETQDGLVKRSVSIKL